MPGGGGSPGVFANSAASSAADAINGVLSGSRTAASPSIV